MLLRSEAAQIARGIADTKPSVNAGVCKYLMGKRKAMLAQKRKASQAFARDAVREIDRILRARKG